MTATSSSRAIPGGPVRRSLDDLSAFFALCREREEALDIRFDRGAADFERSGHLAAFGFYTAGDRKFWYFRDLVLDRDKYFLLMDDMLRKYGFDARECGKRLWMSRDDIGRLSRSGHVIGLHSHTHPTSIKDLSREGQFGEYARNQRILTDITGSPPTSASYPCGSYNDDTGGIMRELGVDTGFDSFMHPPSGSLHIPRQDHANLLIEIRENA